jgi:transposase-like protein
VIRKQYSDDFKRETVRMRRAGIPREQIIAKRGICGSMLANWMKKFPDEPPGAAPPTHKKNGGNSTALIVAKPLNGNGANHAHEDGDNDEHVKKQQVYALVAQGHKIKEAAVMVGVPITTAYGWRMKDKKARGQLVRRKMHAIEARPVESDSVAVLVSAAEKALLNLRQVKRLKRESMQRNEPGADDYSDEFCHSQIAYNALARAFGVK